MAAGFVEIFETLNELAFVVQVLVFTYSLFWLYMTFRDMQILFGLSATIAGYLIFIHGISMTVLVAGFVFLILFGMQIQQVLWFGLFPLLGFHISGDRLVRVDEIDPHRQQQRLQTIQERMDEGGDLSKDDALFYQKHIGQQQMQQQDPSQLAYQQQRRMMGY